MYLSDGWIYIKTGEFRRPHFGEYWVRRYKDDVRTGEIKMMVNILKKLFRATGKEKVINIESEKIDAVRFTQVRQGYQPCFSNCDIKVEYKWCLRCSLSSGCRRKLVRV